MRYNDHLPSNVHVLRPCKLALADRLDQFLKKHALTADEAAARSDPTRPKTPGINAMICASCGQAEYIARDYCRCGHYLRGQLEDEFLAWEEQIQADHAQLADVTAEKLKPLRFIFLASSPIIAVPMLYLAFWAEGISVHPILWMMAGIALLGAAAVIERVLQRPVETSMQFLDTYTFESFVEDRFFRLKVQG